MSGILSTPLVLYHGSSDGSFARHLLEASTTPPLLKRLVKAVLPAPRPKPLIPLICHLDGSSGYGTYTSQLALELQRRGYQLEIWSPAWNEKDAPLPDSLKRSLLPSPRKHDWELFIYPCVIQPKRLILNAPNVAYLTMWESTRLVSPNDPERSQGVNLLNRCKVVMTPNAWNASVFSSCGVNTPIRLTPLGTDVSVFTPAPLDATSTPFVFGTAARTNSGGIRKGFNLVVSAFQLAFPHEPDVRLRVKCFHDDPLLETGGDKRIEQLRRFLPTADLVAWYHSLHCFVSGSASEGWGRHQQEAMCCGRPVIGIAFGGVCEFFNEENGYACDWTLEPGEGIYRNMGHYAKPSVASLAAQMRLAYLHRRDLRRKSVLATKSARRFTIEHSADRILAVLKEFHFLD